MWIGVLWVGLRVAMWITHVGGKFHHGLLEKSLIDILRSSCLFSSKHSFWRTTCFESVVPFAGCWSLEFNPTGSLQEIAQGIFL